MSKTTITINDLSFAVEDTGGDGASVLLLHGFPDSSALWRHQIPALTAAGYRVIAPDLRGYGDSDRPEGADQYRLELLASDILGVLDALDVGSTSVVGHDWGAALGWGLAALTPERVNRFVALSVGHPGGYFGRPSGIPEDVLRRIMTERASGAGLRVIAEGLTADGVPTARGALKWSTSTVQAALAGQDAAKLRATAAGV